MPALPLTAPPLTAPPLTAPPLTAPPLTAPPLTAPSLAVPREVPVDEDGIGALVSRLPALLGCYPTSALVAIYARNHTIARLTRHDLTTPDLARVCVRAQADMHAESVFLVVVDRGVEPFPGSGRSRVDSLPYDTVLWPVYEALEDAGVRIGHAVWTPKIATGAGWCSYEVGTVGGRLPDPVHAVPLAVASQLGPTVYPARPAADRQLCPSADERHCAAFMLRHANLRSLCQLRDFQRRTIRAALNRTLQGRPVQTWDERTILAYALEGPAARDAIVRDLVAHDLAAATQPLWTALTRSTPPPLQTWPALLLGFTAHLQDDRALGLAALHTALRADPRHEVARLMLELLARGQGPDQIQWSAADLGPDWELTPYDGDERALTLRLPQ